MWTEYSTHDEHMDFTAGTTEMYVRHNAKILSKSEDITGDCPPTAYIAEAAGSPRQTSCRATQQASAPCYYISATYRLRTSFNYI